MEIDGRGGGEEFTGWVKVREEFWIVYLEGDWIRNKYEVWFEWF